jgi:transposase
MPNKLNPDRELIIQKYVIENKSLKLTAKEMGCGRTTLSRYLKSYKIEKRDRYSLHRKNMNFSKFNLIAAYKNKTVKQVAKQFGCSKNTIIRYLKKYGIKKRYRYELHKKIFAGKGNPFYNKKHTKETRDTISKTMIERGVSKGKNNPSYIDGRSFLPYTIEFNQDLKDKIRQRDNYTCQNCLMTEEEHLVVFGTNLHTHHIDYCKENCKETNLIALCNGCNTRANFNRSYWQEFFQNKIGSKI